MFREFKISIHNIQKHSDQKTSICLLLLKIGVHTRIGLLNFLMEELQSIFMFTNLG